MGFDAKNVVVGGVPSQTHSTKVNATPPPTQELSQSELEFLILLLKDSNFRGEQVEMLYHLVLKLQHQYTNLKK